MCKERNQVSQLVKLPKSGTILDADAIKFVGRDNKTIGAYLIFIFDHEGAPVPIIDGVDLDALIEGGYVKVLPQPKAANDAGVETKVVVA
jgi:hypothetical protein